MRIGLIADTHGWLGEDARAALEGCDHIVHAGDVGDGVLEPLATLAPLTAVRGNNDTAGDASRLPAVGYLEVAGSRLCVVHRLVDAPAAADWDILVYGHCHRRHEDREGRRLLLNPGAAGRRGFHRERSLALLELANAEPSVTFVTLGPRSASR